MRDNLSQTSTLHTSTATLEENAAIENFVRLQQSQTEFLDWLNTNEKLAIVDHYTYRKIR
jgi:hypothetical protein